MNGWEPKPVDQEWIAKLTPQERAMLTLSQASEEFLAKTITMYRNLVMIEFPWAAIEFVVNAKGVPVEVGIFSRKRELTNKYQPAKDSYAAQLLGEIFGWNDGDDSQRKLRSICQSWMSAFGRTKFSDELHQAILSGQTLEQFGTSRGWPQ